MHSQKTMRVSSRLRNTKTHSFNIYAACDSALSQPSKNPVYKDLLTWRPAITTVCPSPLSITALIPGVGLGPTRSTSKLPSRDKKKKTLKNAIMAPDGYVVINSDSSQIEARVLVWLAGQTDVVQMFAEGRDVYSEFATKIYKKQISKADPIERFVGKTCILGLGYGTGAKKLQHTLKTQPPGAVVELNEAKRIVNIYRMRTIKFLTSGMSAIKCSLT
jgi:hypothetical protein